MSLPRKLVSGHYVDDTPLEFNTYNYLIGGKMVVGKASISEDYADMIRDGDADAKFAVKQDLINQLTKYMLENNLVEFTSWDDPVYDRKHVAVRAYLAPDDQIKILRVANKI
jgi:hypothetical protein